MTKYDFSGYATKNDLKCSDGRTIRRDAFKENDGSVVPLVWQHQHNDPFNVLGHAQLENRADGVYAYCYLNDSEQGQHAKTLVEHGDISSLSIFANRLQQRGGDVLHGVIREVSLVLAGANPGAFIEECCVTHSDDGTDILEANIYSDSPIHMLSHADETEDKQEKKEEKEDNVADSEKTVQDVVDSMTEEQKNVLYFLVGQAAEGEEVDVEEETEEEIAQSEGYDDMKYNVFDSHDDENTLSHSELNSYIEEARSGRQKLSDVFIAHSIDNIDILFPEAKLVTPTPDMISRQMDWVSGVWSGVKKSPFSRIKSVAADVTADEARALGYVKGDKKEEEVIDLLTRTTTPQTVYKVQKLDRDDVIDITDFDVIVWIKAEMRMMLDEEIARAIFVGDGRAANSRQKIKEDNIRPIYKDDDLYTIHYKVELEADMSTDDKSAALVEAALRARKDYKGSGNPTMYASNEVINDMLLAKDKIGRRLYATMTELADALRVKEIVEVPVLENAQRKATIEGTEKTFDLKALIVNLADYTVGADKGGEVNFFDDFDLDYNKLEYLIETRVSGALTHPYSAIALETDASGASARISG